MEAQELDAVSETQQSASIENLTLFRIVVVSKSDPAVVIEIRRLTT